MGYQRQKADVPAIPSQRAHDEARTLFKHIPYSALRMLAQLILDKTKRKLPIDNKAQCVAVIRGLTPAPPRKPRIVADSPFLFGADQYVNNGR
jgi:hypothetical protein